MFDIGFWEMAFIGVIALIVIGPERLPRVARNVGAWVGKGRRMVQEIKADVKKEIDAEELAQMRELKNELSSATEDLKDMTNVEIDKDPLGLKEAGESIKSSVDGDSEEAVLSTTSKSSKAAKKKKASTKKTAGTKAKKTTAKKKTATRKTTKKKAAGTQAAKKKTSTKASSKKKVAKKATTKKAASKTRSAKSAP